MDYLTFTAYLSKAKRGFVKTRYEQDSHYRSVLFHQFAESYRWYCKTHELLDEYDRISYDVMQYERRLQLYRDSLK